MTESLTALFDALHAERVRDWDPAKLDANIALRRSLVDAFDPATVVAVGDRIAPFTLERADGGAATLDDLVADRPVLLIFFRFADCPACNLALPHYDRALAPALRDAGVNLVAVSPHLPERGGDAIRARHGLSFAVLADRDNRLARRLGLTFVPDTPVPTGDAPWVGSLTGTGTWELPQPAVILIDRDHVARFVDVSPDWLARTEATQILDAVALKATA